jgi:hypothetical protein
LRSVRIGAGKSKKISAAVLRNDARGVKESDQFVPREVVSGSSGVRGDVGEIDGKAAAKQQRMSSKVWQERTPQITG